MKKDVLWSLTDIFRTHISQKVRQKIKLRRKGERNRSVLFPFLFTRFSVYPASSCAVSIVCDLRKYTDAFCKSAHIAPDILDRIKCLRFAV